MAVGVLKDSETSHSTGISASATTTRFAVPQPTFCRGVETAISGSPLSDVRARGGGAEALDEQDGDDRHADEDQDRDRRPEPQVQRVEQVVPGEDRDRPGVVTALGQEDDVVEAPERVQRPEQQRDQDGGLYQRRRDLREALTGGGAVYLRGLLQVLGNQGEPGQQQQPHERGGLPDLRQDDDPDGLDVRGQRRAVVERRGEGALARRPRLPPPGGVRGGL